MENDLDNSVLLLINSFLHKLNNAIGLIRARTQFFEFQMTETLKKDHKLSDYIKETTEMCDEIRSFVDELKISLTQPEAKKSISVVNSLSEAIEYQKSPNTIQTTIDVENDIPSIQASSSLVDVFKNLIKNAYEAMPEGGKLEIKVQLNDEKQQIEILFKDNGRGIPQYFAKTLFLPYFSTKEKKGHGLGLWWSKSYLNSIGGSLELAWSEQGEGSCFLVSLPLKN